MDTTLERPDRLENLPISFFAMIMGLAGLTIAWEKAQVLFGLDLGINPNPFKVSVHPLSNLAVETWGWLAF